MTMTGLDKDSFPIRLQVEIVTTIQYDRMWFVCKI